MTEAERAKIHEVAALRGVTSGTPGYLMLETLLDKRPSDRGFDVCWQVIRAMFSAWPEEKRRAFEVSLRPTQQRSRVSREGFWAFGRFQQRRGRRCSVSHAKLPKLTPRLHERSQKRRLSPTRNRVNAGELGVSPHPPPN